MLINDQFSHEELANFPRAAPGLDPDDRMAAAGYVFPGPTYACGENISWPARAERSTRPRRSSTSTGRCSCRRAIAINILDRRLPRGRHRPADHGHVHQNGGTYNSSMVTQNFALSGTKVFVTGVVYNDTVVNDNFFSVGEQLAAAPSPPAGVSDTTGAGGGYELGFDRGRRQDDRLQPGDRHCHQRRVTLGRATSRSTSSTATRCGPTPASHGSGPVTELHALGIQGISSPAGQRARLFGNAAANRLTGAAGNDKLDGGGGNDVIRAAPATTPSIGGRHRHVTGGLNNDFFVFNAPLKARQPRHHHRLQPRRRHVPAGERGHDALGAGGMRSTRHSSAPARPRSTPTTTSSTTGDRAPSYDINGNGAGGATARRARHRGRALAANDFVGDLKRRRRGLRSTMEIG